MASIGKKALIKTGTPSTETDISANCDDAEWPIDFSEVDTTSFGTDSDETSSPTTQKSEIKLGGNWDGTIDGIIRPLLGVEGKSLVVAPLRITGSPRRTCTGYWKTFSTKTPAKGKNTWSGVFVKVGPATYDTVP